MREQSPAKDEIGCDGLGSSSLAQVSPFGYRSQY